MMRREEPADPANEFWDYSSLQEIRGDLLERLFGKRPASELDREAGRRVLERLAEALSGKDKRGEAKKGEAKPGNQREDFLDWLRDLKEKCADEVRSEARRVYIELSRERTPPSTDDLQRWFSKLVGFALMRVDPRYQLTYYIDIQHHFLPEDIIKSVMKSVRVPFDEGSVGAAARHGRLSLADSVMDSRGVVATEDLLMGNISIMMVGVGDLASNGNFSEPRPRWSPTIDAPKPSLRPEGCAAVVFCFFPLAGVFENVEPTETALVLEAFESVCRLHERAVLAEIRLRDAEFVSEQTYKGLSKPEGDEDPTLDVLASTKIENPTGGMIAVRHDPPAIRVCLPRLEAALRPALELPIVRDVPDNLIATMLNSHVHLVPLGSAAPDTVDPPMMIVLHAAKPVDVGKLRELEATSVCQFLDAFLNFTRTRELAYAQSSYPVKTSISYRTAKVTVDACEALARFIARGIVSPDDAERDAPVMDRSLRSALRHYGDTLLPGELGEDLTYLVGSFGPIAGDLLAVSVHYSARHHLEPVSPEAREAESETLAAIRRRISKQPAYLRLLRRAAVRSFFDADDRDRYIDSPVHSGTEAPIEVRRSASRIEHEVSIDLFQSGNFIGTMRFKNDPRYRVASLALRQDTFQAWLQRLYVEKAKLRRSVLRDLENRMAAPEKPVSRVFLGREYPVEVYALHGAMSPQGKTLAERLGDYEQRIEHGATVEWSLLVRNILHHLSEPLAALDFFASLIERDRDAEHKIRYTVRSTWRWLEAMLMLAHDERSPREDDHGQWEPLARVIDAALSVALIGFAAGLTDFQAKCWRLDQTSPREHMWSKLNPQSDPKYVERRSTGKFEVCKEALPNGLVVRPEKWPQVEVSGSLILLSILVEIFRNALNAASNTDEGDAWLEIDVRRKGFEVLVVIENTADPEDGEDLWGVDWHPPGRSTESAGGDFIEQARMLGLELSRSKEKAEDPQWRRMRVDVRVPRHWVREAHGRR